MGVMMMMMMMCVCVCIIVYTQTNSRCVLCVCAHTHTTQGAENMIEGLAALELYAQKLSAAHRELFLQVPQMKRCAECVLYQ